MQTVAVNAPDSYLRYPRYKYQLEGKLLWAMFSWPFSVCAEQMQELDLKEVSDHFFSDNTQTSLMVTLQKLCDDNGLL